MSQAMSLFNFARRSNSNTTEGDSNTIVNANLGSLESAGGNGRTPFVWAVNNRSHNLAYVLIKAGANPNAIYNNTKTVLSELNAKSTKTNFDNYIIHLITISTGSSGPKEYPTFDQFNGSIQVASGPSTYAKGDLLKLLQQQDKNPSYSLSQATALVNANLQYINDADNTGNNDTGRTALIWASQSRAPNLVYALIVAGANPTLNFVAATNPSGIPTMYLDALQAAYQQNKGSPEDLYIIDVLTRAKAEWESTGNINPSNYRRFLSGGYRKNTRKRRRNRKSKSKRR